MDTIVIVDMQVGLLKGDPKHDLDGVIGRIDLLTAAIRGRGGKVVWIRHCGTDDDFAPQRRARNSCRSSCAIQPTSSCRRR